MADPTNSKQIHASILALKDDTSNLGSFLYRFFFFVDFNSSSIIFMNFDSKASVFKSQFAILTSKFLYNS